MTHALGRRSILSRPRFFSRKPCQNGAPMTIVCCFSATMGTSKQYLPDFHLAAVPSVSGPRRLPDRESLAGAGDEDLGQSCVGLSNSHLDPELSQATGQTDRTLGPTPRPTRYLATPREGSRIDSPHRHNPKPSPAPNPADKASVISLVRSARNNCPAFKDYPENQPDSHTRPCGDPGEARGEQGAERDEEHSLADQVRQCVNVSPPIIRQEGHQSLWAQDGSLGPRKVRWGPSLDHSYHEPDYHCRAEPASRFRRPRTAYYRCSQRRAAQRPDHRGRIRNPAPDRELK